MHIHRRITAIAGLAACVLGASAIPASARTFDVNGNGSIVSAQPTTSPSTSIPPALPRVNASQLAEIERAQQHAAAYAPPKGAQYSTAELNAYGAPATGHISSGVAGVATPQAGFDWGDAGIGAAASFVLVLLAFGGAIVISQRRARRSRRTTALPS